MTLRVYVDKKDIGKTHWAMQSLKKAMAWDEQRFGELLSEMRKQNVGGGRPDTADSFVKGWSTTWRYSTLSPWATSTWYAQALPLRTLRSLSMMFDPADFTMVCNSAPWKTKR